MSWSYSRAGRAAKIGAIVKQEFVDVKGCPIGSAEEAAKNALGEVAETLCASLKGNPAIKIVAHGSAWNEGDGAKHQHAQFTFETIHDFLD